MEQSELDMILQVVENPVRRKIIKRLSQEPCYALQLSKELGLGQPLVAKHLGVMEAAGLVSSVAEASPAGPPRKKFSLARGVSITMDVGPNTFIERGTAFEARPKRKSSPKAGQFSSELERAKGAEDDKGRLSMLSDLLARVDKRIEEVEGEHAELVDVRNQAMSEASKVASKLDAMDMRRVLFHILDEHDTAVDSISEALNMREISVKGILEELYREYFE